MTNQVRVFAATLPLLALILSDARAAEPSPKADIDKKAGPAVAFVAARPASSAFCVHESGLFLTAHHAVQDYTGEGAVTLVLDAGGKDQRVLKAVVVRRNLEHDLALLRAETSEKLPALELGTDDKLGELDELVSVGFPTDAKRRPDEYPRYASKPGSVTSLQRESNRVTLRRIQLDAPLGFGYVGGPVLDTSGKVVGLLGGVPTTPGPAPKGVDLVVPVGHIRRFLEKPEVVLSAAPVDPKKRAEPIEFRVAIAAFPPPAKPYDVELIVDWGDGPKRHAMKAEAGGYAVTAAAFGPEAAIRPRVEIRFPNGGFAGPVENTVFSVAGKKQSLNAVRTVRFGAAPRVVLGTGEILEGPLEGLGTLAVAVGGQNLPLKTGKALELTVDPGTPPRTSYSCTVVAKLLDREVARDTSERYLAGSEPVGAEALLKDRFVKPPAAARPTSYLKIVSSPGEPVGQGKTHLFDGKDFTVTSRHVGGVSANSPVFRLEISGPRNPADHMVGPLTPGEYLGARGLPVLADRPGLTFALAERAINAPVGKFVVWELEMKGEKVVRCAIDFRLQDPNTRAPIVGLLRHNSSFE